MGDRANIVIKYADEQVCLYTHWGGSELPETLKSALIRGKSRWYDFQYLARIIFCEMIQNDVFGLTGYGISSNIHDGDTNVLLIDIDQQTVNNTPFDEFIR